MLILLSDGAGLTARQTATVLARAGHRVEALSPAGLCLCRMTRHVRKVHDVPALGRDPFGWLAAALAVAARRGADVLLPVQEQVAVMALAQDRIADAGLATAVPDFAALAQVQDKVSAFRTLARAGVPQPAGVVATSVAEIEAAGAELAGAAQAGAESARAVEAGAGSARSGQAGWPLFVKMPIGTASAGVRRAGSPDELRQVAEDYERLGALGPDGVLVQAPVAGPLAMVQAVFARGELVAFHACERVREGSSGGASHKLGLDLPEARTHMAALGAFLDWHGALSADVILGPDGPRFIDINPRLVEPLNALASGVDLTGALLEVARHGSARTLEPLEPQPAAAPGARTHQLLLAVLGAAQQGGRRDVARELARAVLHRGEYRDSREELTPGRGDLLAPLPVTVIALATLVRPDAWRHFVGGSAGAYSLTPAAWRQISQAAGAGAPGPPSGESEVSRR
jgi:hypothetical protein